jgi:hypothetical protein
VETAAAPFWRLLRAYSPDARIVTVHRPVAAVAASLRAAGMVFEDAMMLPVLEHHEAKLRQIETRLPGVLSVQYHELADEAVCARIFEHCTGLPHDHGWWHQIAGVNLQVSVPHMMRYFMAHAQQLDKLTKQAKHRTMTLFARPTEIDGVTFQCEPFRQFYADAKLLFHEHLTQTEQSPEDHAQKNIELLERLDDMGALQVLTSRSNGRLFGYLMSVIGPSLDERDRQMAFHTIFFASPLIRNLGMKLQRAALAALQARGVAEVQMRAGHRGSGPRLGTFYRRLGAEEFGQLYRLELGG